MQDFYERTRDLWFRFKHSYSLFVVQYNHMFIGLHSEWYNISGEDFSFYKSDFF